MCIRPLPQWHAVKNFLLAAAVWRQWTEQWDAVCRRDVYYRHGMTTGKGIKKAALSRGKSRLKIG